MVATVLVHAGVVGARGVWTKDEGEAVLMISSWLRHS